MIFQKLKITIWNQLAYHFSLILLNNNKFTLKKYFPHLLGIKYCFSFMLNNSIVIGAAQFGLTYRLSNTYNKIVSFTKIKRENDV